MSKRRKKGGFLMLAGLLLIVAAFLFAGHNLLEERSAGQAAGAALEKLRAALIVQRGAGEPENSLAAVPAQVTLQSGAPDAALVNGVQGVFSVEPAPLDSPAIGTIVPVASASPGPGSPSAAVSASPMPGSPSAVAPASPGSFASPGPIVSPAPQDAALMQEPVFIRYPEMEMPVIGIDGENYIGVLEIPALNLALPVMDEWSYPRLKIAPCRYAGSVYSRDCVIAGHNYEEHLRYIGQLNPGDEVRFTDAEGNVFCYSVLCQEILAPAEVEAMCTGDWDLTLFTCKVGGRRRITVRCRLESYVCAQN